MNLKDRALPEAEFVRRIETLLNKNDFEACIPWPAEPVPCWTADFYPERILDVGPGLGGMTASVLERFAQWGRLCNLKELVLIEGDESLHPRGAGGLRQHLQATIRTVLEKHGLTDVLVTVVIGEVVVSGTRLGKPSVPELERYGRFDLVLLSHVLYYFDGIAGALLLQALESIHLTSGGRIWLVLRRRDSPIYETLKRTLAQIGLPDSRPDDYSDFWINEINSRQLPLEIVASATQTFLRNRDDEARFEAAYLLMWREEPAPSYEDSKANAVRSLMHLREPLFLEDHLILGGVSRGR